MRSISHRSALLTLAFPLVFCSSARGVAGPWVDNTEARARLIGNAEGLGLEFDLQPGWHVYWKNSGDAGYAPRVDFGATSAIRNARLLFPAPQRFELPAGMVSFGYSKAVLYPIAATVAQPPGESLAVRARLDYLVCRDECIPHTAALTLTLPAKTDAGDAESVRLAEARAALPLPTAAAPGAPQVTLHAAADPEGALTLELLAAGGTWRAAAPDLFFEAHPLFALGRPELSAAKGGLRFRVRLQPLDLTKVLPATTIFAWTLTGFERAATGANVPAPVALSGTTSVGLPR